MESIVNMILVITALALGYYVFRKHRQHRLDLRARMFGITSALLIPFGLAWAVSSLYENEMQAAIAGIVVFSGFGGICFILARKGWTAWGEDGENGSKTSLPGSGLKITATVLLCIGLLMLPITWQARKGVNIITNQQQMQILLKERLVSNGAISQSIKDILMYQTLYGKYPEKLEIRMVQSLFSGVKDDEMVNLITMLVPENERFQMVEAITAALSNWFSEKTQYPSFVLKPTVYVERIKNNAEGIVSWIYDNFHFFPMPAETIRKFSRGDFSTDIRDYIGDPPEHLKEQLISPFAKALELQVGALTIPEAIHLEETLSQKLTMQRMEAARTRLKTAGFLFKYAWIAAALLIVLAVGLLFFIRDWKSIWLGSTVAVACFSGFGAHMVLANRLGLTEKIISLLTKSSPAPVLGILNRLLPELISMSDSVIGYVLICLAAGATVFTGWIYFSDNGFLIRNQKAAIKQQV